jgi:enoyl-CoA hydratase/carnithine racemase
MIEALRDGGVLELRLNRPEKRNAQTPAMLDELARAAGELDPAVRAIVLTGEGEVFCAGFNVALCRDDRGALAALLTGLSRAVRALRRAPVPVVAAAHGAAIAGGCALVAAADFVVADAGAKFGYPVVRLGISPALNAPFLRQAISDGACRERLLEGTVIDGAEAQRIGLVSHLVASPGEVLVRAMELARGLGAKPARGMQATKELLNRLDGSSDDATIDGALAASLSIADSEECRGRLSAMWSR